MHLSWAMLMAWNAKRLHWRLLFTIYALIMAAATLAIGQHYLIDLLAAVPYVVVIQIVAARLLHPNKIQAPVSPLRAPETWVQND